MVAGKFYHVPSDLKLKDDVTYDNSQEGEWICGTDLLHTGSRKRPRLLPQDVKMFIFIDKKPTKAKDCPPWCCHQMPLHTSHTTQIGESFSRHNPHNLNLGGDTTTAQPKPSMKIHHKKNLLKRFIQNQND